MAGSLGFGINEEDCSLAKGTHFERCSFIRDGIPCIVLLQDLQVALHPFKPGMTVLLKYFHELSCFLPLLDILRIDR